MIKLFIVISILIHGLVIFWLSNQNVVIRGEGEPYYFEVLEVSKFSNTTHQSAPFFEKHNQVNETKLKRKTSFEDSNLNKINNDQELSSLSEVHNKGAGGDLAQYYVVKNKLITSRGGGVGIDWTSPDYPFLARKNKEQGRIKLYASCELGKRCQVQIVESSGYFRLDQSVLKSYENFVPPIDLNAELVYVFRLNDKD